MIKRLPSTFVALASLVWPAWVRAQTVRLGGEFQVNTYTTSYQYDPKVAKDGMGNFVVVWDSLGQDGSRHGIFGQRFDAAADTLDQEFRVNTYTTSYQSYPSVSADSSGNFVVVWQSYRQDGSYYGVFGQRYNSAGVPQGSEFQVNGITAYDQNRPAVAKDSTGKFVVAWQDATRDGYDTGVFAQRFDAVGNKQSSQFRVNTYTTSSQGYPALGRDSSGNFIVTWQSYKQDLSGPGIYGQRFTSNASKNGVEFRISTYITGAQSYPSIAVGSTGNFVVAWESPQDGSGTGVFGQRYSSSGAKIGGEFQVNTYTTNDQRSAAVAMDGSGNFVVVWMSLGQDGSFEGIFGQRFTSGGVPRGSEFRVNTTTNSSQANPAVAADSAGNFVVVWQGFEQNGDGYDIFGQRFSGSDCVAPSVSAPISQMVCQDGSVTFGVTASGTGPFTYRWRKGSTELSDGPFIHGSKTANLTIEQVSTVDVGDYSCDVTDYCLPPASATSAAASLTFSTGQGAGPVAMLSVQKTNGGATLEFHWSETTDASDYVIVGDVDPSGPFLTVLGSSASGSEGLVLPMPSGGTRYFLAAGRNAACGIGPRR